MRNDPTNVANTLAQPLDDGLDVRLLGVLSAKILPVAIERDSSAPLPPERRWLV